MIGFFAFRLFGARQPVPALVGMVVVVPVVVVVITDVPKPIAVPVIAEAIRVSSVR